MRLIIPAIALIPLVSGAVLVILGSLTTISIIATIAVEDCKKLLKPRE